jgi:hypothetical protein
VALVDNNELQDLLLEDKDHQSFMVGVVRMNKTGRNYIKREPSNAIKGIAVLDSVSENVDCMFVHLRENVALTRNLKTCPDETLHILWPYCSIIILQ